MDAHSLKRNALAVVVGLLVVVFPPAYAGNSDSVTIVYRAGGVSDDSQRSVVPTKQQYLAASKRLAERRILFAGQRSQAAVVITNNQCVHGAENETTGAQCDNLTTNNNDR